MNVGGWLDHMDKDYYHRDHRFMGWVFCDLLDYYYGMSAAALLQERRGRSGWLTAAFMVPVLLAFKFSNSRVKWDYSKAYRRTPPPPNDETNTTVEEFDAMWDEGEPV